MDDEKIELYLIECDRCGTDFYYSGSDVIEVCPKCKYHRLQYKKTVEAVISKILDKNET